MNITPSEAEEALSAIEVIMKKTRRTISSIRRLQISFNLGRGLVFWLSGVTIPASPNCRLPMDWP